MTPQNGDGFAAPDPDARPSGSPAAASAGPTAATTPSADGGAPAPPAVGEKRSRTALSLHEKAVVKSFCEEKVGASKARGELVPSQDQLRREIAAKFGWRCGRSTLSKIVALDWAALQQGAFRNPNMKRQRRPLFPAFEDDLVRFIATHVDDDSAGVDAGGALERQEPSGEGAAVPVAEDKDKKAALTEALILEEAQRLKQVHGIRDEQLVLSVGWLARFKHRHGIRLRKAPTNSKEAVSSSSSSSEIPNVAVVGGALSGVEVANWTAVDPLLLSGPIVMDGLHTISDQAGTAAPNYRKRAMSVPPSERRPGGKADKNAWNSLSIPSSSALCGLVASSPTRLVVESWIAKLPAAIRELRADCRCLTHTLPAHGLSGLNVVVIGANSSLEAFVAASLVGQDGAVTCIETLDAAREVARQSVDDYVRTTLGYPTTTIKIIGQSAVSELKSAQGKADFVVVNCALQTVKSSELPALLQVASRFLKPGGELRFSLVCSSRRPSSTREGADATPLPGFERLDEIAKDELSASPYILDVCSWLQALPRKQEIRILTSELIKDGMPSNAAPSSPSATFYQCTFRAFSLDGREDTFEDYGQTVTYRGGDYKGSESEAYLLDNEFRFPRGTSVPVDGNTAMILQSSWLRRLFVVEGDRRSHRGAFGRVGWLAGLKPSAASATFNTASEAHIKSHPHDLAVVDI